MKVVLSALDQLAAAEAQADGCLPKPFHLLWTGTAIVGFGRAATPAYERHPNW